jgi:hypothetical protein
VLVPTFGIRALWLRTVAAVVRGESAVSSATGEAARCDIVCATSVSVETLHGGAAARRGGAGARWGARWRRMEAEVQLHGRL